jgi:hypothetical protein
MASFLLKAYARQVMLYQAANTVREIHITIANTDKNSQNIIPEGQGFEFYISDRNSNYDCQYI